jgi:DNA-directed RNA polymerase subunit M/transcription elongation factor TFIIS
VFNIRGIPRNEYFRGVMTIQFCPKCGSLLRPEKNKAGKTILKCSCGYKSSAKEAEGYKVKFPIRHTERDYIVVVEDEGEEGKKRKKREIDEDERQEMLELMLDYFPDD